MLKGYKALGFDTGDSETPIIPIIIKDSLKVYQMCRRLFENGVFVNPVVNPAVPPGRELLRTSFMATHTEEQLDRVLNAFEKVGKELGVIYHGIRWNDHVKPSPLKEVKTDKDLLAFIRFPWEIYKGDPYWVPPLIKDQLQKFSPDHPFRSHSEMILFLAYQEGRIVGRIAGIIDHHYVEFHQEKLGFFGFFESIREPEVAETLMTQVRNWLKGRGMEKMAGPMNPSTNDECGLLIDGFEASPCLMMPYNPGYYPDLIERAGFKKAMDLYAYLLEESTFQLRSSEPDHGAVGEKRTPASHSAYQPPEVLIAN